jgi:MFS family permease
MAVSTSTAGDRNWTLIILYFNVILYATCFQIQRPLEPFMVEKLNLVGDSSKEYAKLQSFFSVMQTIGSLISGVLLDKFGVKGGFIVSFGASAMSYALLSQATTLNLLYISKIPTVFQSGFLCAQVCASQLTTDGPERIKALGRLTMCYTLGMIIGPSVGGMLGASGNYYLGAKVAVAGSLLSVFLSLLAPSVPLSDDVQKAAKVTSTAESSDKSESPSVIAVLRLAWLFLLTKTITSVANAMNAATFPLILKDIYALNEQSLGFIMSFMSAFNAVVNGVFLGPIVTLAGGDLNFIIVFCMGAMAVASIAQSVTALNVVTQWSSSSGFYEYVALSVILSIFQFLLSTSITGESTTRVGANGKGTLLGLEHALFAAARVIAPQAGVYFLSTGGVAMASGVCGCIFASMYCGWKFFIPTGSSSSSNSSDEKTDGKQHHPHSIALNEKKMW